MLNLPPQPGAVGLALLVAGACTGAVLLVTLRTRLAAELGWQPRAVESWLVAVVLAVSVAGAPFTLWRVAVDIRETSGFSAAHKRYVGAETKLIDGELAARVGTVIPEDATYFVAVAPDAHHEIRDSLAFWLGYALVPRQRVREQGEADWIVAWGATPARLGLDARRPTLVGRNRLVADEPVYVAATAP